jgi:hypothetical protein
MARRLQAPPLGTYSLFCPYCQKIGVLEITPETGNELICACGKKSRFRIFTIRYKHSRKNGSLRNYSVRVIGINGEEELTFEDYNEDDDISLRSGDIAVFFFRYNNPQIVLGIYNYTINKCSLTFLSIPIRAWLNFSAINVKMPRKLITITFLEYYCKYSWFREEINKTNFYESLNLKEEMTK